jgi:uncharacterized protein YbaP (TraB family)
MRVSGRALAACFLALCSLASAATDTPARKPYLYLAESGSHRLVLMGTKHVDISPADYPPPYEARIVQEIRSANAYWGEATVESAAAAGERVTTAPPAHRKRLARQTTRGLVERFGGWRGWRRQPCGMVASLYLGWDAVGPVIRGRATPARILDRGLETIARRAGIPTRALDSPELDAQLDANLDRADATCDLDALVADLPPAQARALHIETREEFLSGDERALQARLGKSSGAAELYALGERNRQWLAKLLRDANGRHFVAVGVAHLFGRDGLLEQLRQRGYRVERLDVPGIPNGPDGE